MIENDDEAVEFDEAVSLALAELVMTTAPRPIVRAGIMPGRRPPSR